MDTTDTTTAPTVNLYGAGGHALVIADILHACGLTVAAIVDDNPAVTSCGSMPVRHETSDSLTGQFIISIGSNRIRRHISGRIAPGRIAAAAIHPSAILSPSATVGVGSVVMAGAVIEARAAVGCHCIINTGATVNHQCNIGDYAHLSPGATLCGNVSVGQGAWIGAGATIVPGISIGPWAIVGAGATVIADVPAGSTVVGTPARPVAGANAQKHSEIGGGNLTLTFSNLGRMAA